MNAAHTGTNGCYCSGCRLPQCRAAHTLYSRRYRRDAATGKLRRDVPVGPVREHLRALVAAGEPYRRLVARSGIPETTITSILYAYAPRGGKPRRRVRFDTAARILALQPEPGRTYIDATGCRRMLQSLLCDGWTLREQAARLGFTVHYIVYGGSALVHRDRVAKIRALYEELSSIAAPADTIHNRARQRGRRFGYAPPEAWDEDSIEDPAAQPKLEPQPLVDDVRVQRAIDGVLAWGQLDPDERRTAVDRLLCAGKSKSAIMRILTISYETATAWIGRSGQVGSQ